MSRLVRLGDLTRDAVSALTDVGPLVIPVGATEQHGPHLPTATDTTLVGAVIEHAAELVRGPAAVVVAPAMPFGSSHHHLPFGATLSLSPATLTAALVELTESALACGFRTVLVLNGHGGNVAAVGAAVDRAGQVRGATIAGTSFWECADVGALPAVEGRVPGHAGEFETSLMLAAAPDQVELSAARPSPSSPPPRIRGAHVAMPDFWKRIDGFTDDPTRANADLGRAALEVLTAGVARVIEEVWALRPAPIS